MKLIVTLLECADILREHGIRLSPTTICDGIEQGVYPFGRIKHVGRTGRRATEIYRKDLMDWIKSKEA